MPDVEHVKLTELLSDLGPVPIWRQMLIGCGCALGAGGLIGIKVAWSLAMGGWSLVAMLAGWLLAVAGLPSRKVEEAEPASGDTSSAPGG